MAQFAEGTRLLGFWRGTYDTDYTEGEHPYTLGSVPCIIEPPTEASTVAVGGYELLEPLELSTIYDRVPDSRFNFNFVRTNVYNFTVKYVHHQFRINYTSSINTKGYEYYNYTELSDTHEYTYKALGRSCPYVHVCIDAGQIPQRDYLVSVALGVTHDTTGVPSSSSIFSPGIASGDLASYQNIIQNMTLSVSKGDRICVTLYEELVLGVLKQFAVIRNIDGTGAVTQQLPNNTDLDSLYVVVNNEPGQWYDYVRWILYNAVEDTYAYDELYTYNTWADIEGNLHWDKYPTVGNGTAWYYTFNGCATTRALLPPQSKDNICETIVSLADLGTILPYGTIYLEDKTQDDKSIKYIGVCFSPEWRLGGNYASYECDSFDARRCHSIVRDYVMYQSDNGTPQEVDTEVVLLGPVTNLYCMSSDYYGLGNHWAQSGGHTYDEKLARINAGSMTLDAFGGALLGSVYMGANLHYDLPVGAQAEAVVMSYLARDSGSLFGHGTNIPWIPTCLVNNQSMIGLQSENINDAYGFRHDYVMTNVSLSSNSVVKIKLYHEGT